MRTIDATIDGWKTKIPLDLFNEIAGIRRSEYREQWWADNCSECESLDVQMNGWDFVINNCHPISDVLQVDPDNVVHVCLNRDDFKKLKGLVGEIRVLLGTTAHIRENFY
jgi:hypothetical protein